MPNPLKFDNQSRKTSLAKRINAHRLHLKDSHKITHADYDENCAQTSLIKRLSKIKALAKKIRSNR